MQLTKPLSLVNKRQQLHAALKTEQLGHYNLHCTLLIIVVLAGPWLLSVY